MIPNSPTVNLAALVAELFPGETVREVQALGPDAHADSAGATGKVAGYGVPLRVTLASADGRVRRVVFHAATANQFGHDRRADRAEGALLAWDTFGRIPGHVRALDVGAVLDGGHLLSLRHAGELYLVTEWAEGTLYADDLRRIAATGEARAVDVERAGALASYLVALHAERPTNAPAYARALRDLVGHGEGIFGIADGYPDDTPSAPRARLDAIERSCLLWRQRLRARHTRLARTHGDFHPFNVVFADTPRSDGTTFQTLDASRGAMGDPADDVTAMALNFPFFALERPTSWRMGLGLLWHRYWEVYLDGSRDGELLDVAAPWWAWRTLVVANPRFYPSLGAAARDRLLTLAERILAGKRLELAWIDAWFP